MPSARWDPVDANISMLFTELPLAARPAAARAAGFAAVEAWWPFDSAVPRDAEVDGFERAVRDAGVQLVALNGYAGNMRAGDRGILSWPGRQQEFLDNLDVVPGLGPGSAAAGSTCCTATGLREPSPPPRMSWRWRTWPPRPGGPACRGCRAAGAAQRGPAVPAADGR